jgi:hypothetical protein
VYLRAAPPTILIRRKGADGIQSELHNGRMRLNAFRGAAQNPKCTESPVCHRLSTITTPRVVVKGFLESLRTFSGSQEALTSGPL